MTDDRRPNYWQPEPRLTPTEIARQIAQARRARRVAWLRSRPAAVVVAAVFGIGFVFTYPAFCAGLLLVGGPIVYGVHRWRVAQAEVERLLRQADAENAQYIADHHAYIRRLERGDR